MSSGSFYIDPKSVTGNTAVLKGEDLRHARLALRLSKGDRVRLYDGLGGIYHAVFQSVSQTVGVLEITAREVEPEPSLDLAVAMGIVRGERFEWAIEKGTELGASTFIPLITERVEDKALRTPWNRKDRLMRIIASTCKQCERARFPLLREPIPLEALNPDGYDLAVAFWESREAPNIAETVESGLHPRSCLMVVGPVGGFTADEARMMEEKGFILAGMGTRVLRTETAVTAGATIIQYLWGDMGTGLRA